MSFAVEEKGESMAMSGSGIVKRAGYLRICRTAARASSV